MCQAKFNVENRATLAERDQIQGIMHSWNHWAGRSKGPALDYWVQDHITPAVIQKVVIANDTSHLSSSDQTLGRGGGVEPPQTFTSD